jgi:hypothetical protein
MASSGDPATSFSVGDGRLTMDRLSEYVGVARFARIWSFWC